VERAPPPRHINNEFSFMFFYEDKFIKGCVFPNFVTQIA